MSQETDMDRRHDAGPGPHLLQRDPVTGQPVAVAAVGEQRQPIDEPGDVETDDVLAESGEAADANPEAAADEAADPEAVLEETAEETEEIAEAEETDPEAVLDETAEAEETDPEAVLDETAEAEGEETDPEAVLDETAEAEETDPEAVLDETAEADESDPEAVLEETAEAEETDPEAVLEETAEAEETDPEAVVDETDPEAVVEEAAETDETEAVLEEGYAEQEPIDGEIVAAEATAAEPYANPDERVLELGEGETVVVAMAAVPDEPREDILPPAPAPQAPVWSAEIERELRTRWQAAQLRFVDDPVAAAAEAKQVLSETVGVLTQRLDGLHDWDSAEADTERLRMVVARYRELFDQLIPRGD